MSTAYADDHADVQTTQIASSSSRLKFTDQLAAIERLSVLLWRYALDTSQSQNTFEGIRGKPSLIALCLENITDVSNLALADLPPKRDEVVGGTQISVVLWNLILQDHVVAPGVPSQIRDDTVVLVPVIAIVRED
jgi:hypothetical protein